MSKLPDFSGRNNRAISIFCWSRTEPGSALWQQAETVGKLAATNGFSVVTGGYCGSMEAVSKGAREVIDAKGEGMNGSSGPQVVGVVASGIFPDRVMEGNRYLTVTQDSNSMLHRIDQLIHQSRYFVILPGTMGTLQELTSIWMQAVLHPSSMPQPLIICFRNPWEKCLRGIAEALQLPAGQLEIIRFVDTAEEAMALIVADEKQLQDNKL